MTRGPSCYGCRVSCREAIRGGEGGLAGHAFRGQHVNRSAVQPGLSGRQVEQVIVPAMLAVMEFHSAVIRCEVAPAVLAQGHEDGLGLARPGRPQCRRMLLCRRMECNSY